MLRAIFWKEWRQQRQFLFAILLLLPVLVGLLLWNGASFADERHPTSDALATAALGVALLQAVVTGSLLFAGEVETGTLAFLDACSAERSRIWRAKMMSALAIALPVLLLPALFGGINEWMWTGFALETLLLAAAASAFARTTFRAIGVAVLLLAGIGIVIALFTPLSTPGALALNCAIVGVTVFASWVRFCRADRQRHGDVAGTLLLRVPPTWMAGSLWFLLRRQWLALLSAAIALVALWIWVSFFLTGKILAIALAPALLFAVGCVFGWNAFVLEQAGAERFLGDQRLPRNRLWLAKVGGWLAATALAVLFVVFVCREAVDQLDGSAAAAIGRDLAFAFLGFSAGQFFGIHDCRLPVVVFLTVLVATPIGAAWYAPLFGGAPAWHFAVVPILLLEASRFELRRWASGRLDGVGHWLRCGAVTVVVFAWTGLLLWQRTAEVPDVGVPFDVAGLTETPADREQLERLAGPVDEMWTQVRKSGVGSFANYGPLSWVFARWRHPEIEMGSASADELRTLTDQVIALGAPDKNRDEYARLIDAAFAGGWATTLKKELAEEPRRVPVLISRETRQSIRRGVLEVAATTCCMKAALLVAENKSEAALDEIALSLAIVRHQFLYGNSEFNFGPAIGGRTQTNVLEATDTMLRRGGDLSFCRGLLKLLDRHAQELPATSESIKTYCLTHPRARFSALNRNGFTGPLTILFDAPLESIRDDRIERAFCRGLINAAEQKVLFLRPRISYKDCMWPVRYLALATPDRSADDWARILSHEAKYEWHFPVILFFPQAQSLGRSSAQLSAVRLACAAALYRHDHGRDVGSLEELAPEHFASLPESPFVECPFVLRRSAGETWNLVHDGMETSSLRTIVPGTQVIEIPEDPTLRVAVPTIR